MLTMPLPADLRGVLLERQLADTGIRSAVVVDGNQLLLDGLAESDHEAAQSVVAAHPSRITKFDALVNEGLSVEEVLTRLEVRA